MLNSKQKAYLRSLANPLKALVLIGKDGLTLNVVESTKTALEAHELVKVSVLKSCPTDVRELMLDLVSSTSLILCNTRFDVWCLGAALL